MTGLKLKQILDRNGVIYAWFGKRVGISKGLMNIYLNHSNPIPEWRQKIIETELKKRNYK